MLRIALIYGSIAGLVVIGTMTLGLVMSGGEGLGSGQAFGYLIMLIALTLIFVGVKQHRDQNLGGVIKFVPALLAGLAIAGIAGVFYVIGWEAYLASTNYAFIEEYTAAVIEKKREAGLSGAELEKLIADMDAMVKNYAKPFFRLPLTFMEIFPVGALVAIVSAAILRNPNVLPARAST
jgi:hypothetical protein